MEVRFLPHETDSQVFESSPLFGVADSKVGYHERGVIIIRPSESQTSTADSGMAFGTRRLPSSGQRGINGNVMYDGIERAEPIDLFRDAPCVCDACHVADCDRLSGRHGGQRLLCSQLVASVQNNLMPLIDEKLGCHFAEPICRSSNKDTRHIYSPDTSFTNDSVIKQLRAFYCERASGSFDMIRHELDAPRQRPAYWQRVGGLDGVQAVLFVHTGS
jgi:hypothetical protein